MRLRQFSLCIALCILSLAPTAFGQGVVGTHTFTILGNNTTHLSSNGNAWIDGDAWAMNCYYGGMEQAFYQQMNALSGNIAYAGAAESASSDCAITSIASQSVAEQLPNGITGGSIVMAGVDGEPGFAWVNICDTNGLINSSFLVDTPTVPLNSPLLGRAPDVLVLVGNFSAAASDSGTGIFGAGVAGPGFNINVGAGGVNGSTTFVAVPSMATTTHSLTFNGAEGINASFSVQVTPGEQLNFNGASGNRLEQIFDGSESGDSHYSVAFEVRRYNSVTGQVVDFHNSDLP